MRCLVVTRCLMVMVLLTLGLGCRQPDSAPKAPPRARLIVRFLDRDAVLDLAAEPGEGAWRLMNAGLWESLEVRWKAGAPRIGAAVVGRTAPDWVLLEDPSRDTHRVVMRGPGPEELAQRNERMDPQERDALTFLGVFWALVWTRR
ncbi:MAG: hypothetical protein H6P99_1752 [Holophagaceae bacterium]|nr:hypothetical protein [Holophagaceae bacterium]